MLIFFAIMLHKGEALSSAHFDLSHILHVCLLNHCTTNLLAPAAFGFSVYLTQHGCKARDTRRQLLLFSLAAPVSGSGCIV